MNRFRHTLSVAVLLLLAATSCSGDDDPVSMNDLWARPTAPGAEAAAIYGTVTNTSDALVELMAGYVAACGRVELREVEIEDDVMQMRPATPEVAFLDPGQSLELEPMGLHLMCLDLAEPLVEGEEQTLELTFADIGVVFGTVEVEDR